MTVAEPQTFPSYKFVSFCLGLLRGIFSALHVCLFSLREEEEEEQQKAGVD